MGLSFLGDYSDFRILGLCIFNFRVIYEKNIKLLFIIYKNKNLNLLFKYYKYDFFYSMDLVYM